ncbi:GNAT family N-acetyltransferase [soil metagenome]
MTNEKNPKTNSQTESETILETNRLILRMWKQSDANALFEILQDAEVVRHIDDGNPFSFEKTLKFLETMEKSRGKNGFCRWKVIEKSSGEIIGSCGFGRLSETNEIELGYLLAQKHWGKGFATEAAGACLKFGFEKLNFREIIALTDSENFGSRKVLEKIGFAKRGIEVYNGEENLVYLAKNNQ